MEEYEHGKPLDHHWMTFDELCHVCDVHYDYITKVETMSVDAEWLLPTLLGHDAAAAAALSTSWKHSTDRGRLPHQQLPALNTGNFDDTE